MLTRNCPAPNSYPARGIELEQASQNHHRCRAGFRSGRTGGIVLDDLNRKDSGSVEIRIVEHLYRWINWQILEKSDPFTKTDSQTIEFRVQVPAGGEKVVTYKVHYTW